MERQAISEIARKYYARPEIKAVLLEHAKQREVVAKYYDKYGKRPDVLEYAKDIDYFLANNTTSFHCSVELWKNPLELSKQLSEAEINALRVGWDLLLDIDCKFLDYSKEATKLIIDALEWHGIKNYGIKFSGGKGFHIILSHAAFPQTITYGKELPTKDFFPTGARIIASYLSDLIEKDLREVLLSMSDEQSIARALGKEVKDLFVGNKFNPFSVVNIDTVLMAHRHLYRMPYSLHEKTGLASVVLSKAKLNAFNVNLAKPSAVMVERYVKKPDENEALELLLNALDWQHKEKILMLDVKSIEERKPIAIKIEAKELKDAYCDCIKNILSGMKQDGRKRALFILLTYFRTLGLSFDEIEKIIAEWNAKNYKPLKEGYIRSQLNWHKRQARTILPPNHDASGFYKELGILGKSCQSVKNPVTYTIKVLKAMRKAKSKAGQKTETEVGRKKSGRKSKEEQDKVEN